MHMLPVPALTALSRRRAIRSSFAHPEAPIPHTHRKRAVSIAALHPTSPHCQRSLQPTGHVD